MHAAKVYDDDRSSISHNDGLHVVVHCNGFETGLRSMVALLDTLLSDTCHPSSKKASKH